MIQAAMFDVGGVLHSLEGKHIRSDIVSTLGITRQQYDQACHELIPLLRRGKMTEQEFWRQFVEMTQAPSPLPDESLWTREYSRRYKIFNETLDIVNALKSRGLKVAILSNTIASQARINKQMGVYEPFSEVILSYQVGLAKPDPAIYKLALRKIRVKPRQAVFIDDRAENVSAAIKLGSNGIIFKDAKSLKIELSKLGINSI